MLEGLAEMLLEGLAAIAEVVVSLFEPKRKGSTALPAEKLQPGWVECLRCGNLHEGARCPRCRYVFRVLPRR
jgi:hypothetical protein